MVGCGGAKQAPDKTAPEATTPEATTQKKAIAKEDIKVGFLYVGPIGDEGYTYAHDQGRLQLEKELGVKTVYVENVPENIDCEKTVRDLIDQGCNVIYATSFGHGEWAYNVSKEFPNVYFGHATGYEKSDNFSNYMGRIYEARYLSGIAAGLKTKDGKIGYVAAMPIPEVIRGINAFTLGVRSVNPEATVTVKWTNSWYDPTLEKAAAIELINTGCDVIGQHCDTTGPQTAAQDKGVFAVGYNAPTLSAAPDAYLTAPLFHWGEYYVADVQSIIDGTWQSQSYWKGLESGIVSLDELSPNCAEGTAEAIDAAKAKILDGSLFVFTGPLKDNTGKEKVAAGEKMTDEQLTSFDWFVEGVVGTIG
ncbi:MAG: BMP family ABC transporter substrate-binding protein, partial [Oscillospiraceae bacterium]